MCDIDLRLPPSFKSLKMFRWNPIHESLSPFDHETAAKWQRGRSFERVTFDRRAMNNSNGVLVYDASGAISFYVLGKVTP